LAALSAEESLEGLEADQEEAPGEEEGLDPDLVELSASDCCCWHLPPS